MGLRFRKVFSGGPLRLILTRRGVGWSWGIPGLRYGVSPTGQRYVSVGFPGLGIYWIKYLTLGTTGVAGSSRTTSSQPPSLPTSPAKTTTGTSPTPSSSSQTPTTQAPWWKQWRQP